MQCNECIKVVLTPQVRCCLISKIQREGYRGSWWGQMSHRQSANTPCLFWRGVSFCSVKQEMLLAIVYRFIMRTSGGKVSYVRMEAAQEGRNAFQVALLPKSIKVCGKKTKKARKFKWLGKLYPAWSLSPSPKKLISEKTKRKENFQLPVVHMSPCNYKEKNKTLENRKKKRKTKH